MYTERTGKGPSISPGQRFSSSQPCPVCGGHDRMPRGNGGRCFGFLSEDGGWAHYTREEYAGDLEQNPNSETYAHKLTGNCRCGERHDSSYTLSAPPNKRRIVRAYDYHNEDGNLLYQVVRYEPKDFRQRRPDGRGGWIWNLEGVRAVLYRLSELVTASEQSAIYILEGEKDVDNLRDALGVVATTNPGGAGKWRDEYAKRVSGQHVVILPHNDEAGRQHAQKVACSVRGIAANVKVVNLPGLPEGGDVSDWLDNGGTSEELERLTRETPEWVEEIESSGRNAPRNGKRCTERNQADRLIYYVLDMGIKLFSDQLGMPHALVDGEPVPLNTRAYKWLRRVLWGLEGISASSESLKAAAETLAAFAEADEEVHELHTRSAFHDGAVYFQLRKGRVVRIDKDGWRIDPEPPVLFRSLANLDPLPYPEEGGSPEEIEGLINMKSPRDKRLLKAYVATVPLAHIPRPILEATGAMGSGKTTLSRMVKRLLDPTVPETVRIDPREFLQKAAHCYIVALDNQNSLPEWPRTRSVVS